MFQDVFEMRYSQMPSFSSDQPDSTATATIVGAGGVGGGRRPNNCIPSDVSGPSTVDPQRRSSNATTAIDGFPGGDAPADESGSHEFLGVENDEKSVKVAHLQQQVSMPETKFNFNIQCFLLRILTERKNVHWKPAYALFLSCPKLAFCDVIRSLVI